MYNVQTNKDYNVMYKVHMFYINTLTKVQNVHINILHTNSSSLFLRTNVILI
jgi:hypothetical protein